MEIIIISLAAIALSIIVFINSKKKEKNIFTEVLPGSYIKDNILILKVSKKSLIKERKGIITIDSYLVFSDYDISEMIFFREENVYTFKVEHISGRSYKIKNDSPDLDLSDSILFVKKLLR